MDDAIKKVGGKRGSLWKQNWDRQEKIYVWPKSNVFTDFIRSVKGAGRKGHRGARTDRGTEDSASRFRTATANSTSSRSPSSIDRSSRLLA